MRPVQWWGGGCPGYGYGGGSTGRGTPWYGSGLVLTVIPHCDLTAGSGTGISHCNHHCNHHCSHHCTPTVAKTVKNSGFSVENSGFFLVRSGQKTSCLLARNVMFYVKTMTFLTRVPLIQEALKVLKTVNFMKNH